MPIVHLAERALIEVTGPDAEPFLQNILTTDLAAIAEGEAWPGALLTPQGKIMFDFLISRLPGGGFLIDLRGDVAEDFTRRLMLYRLRAKAEISKRDQTVVAIRWESDSASLQTDSTAVRDRRFPVAVWRHYAGLPAPDAPAEIWHRLRIAHGIAESGTDYELGDAFPHDVLLDQTGGVGMRKGCYVGQEVVSRMQHRGTARRRVLLVSGDGALPAPGTAITAAGRAVGALGSVDTSEGIAIVRIDRVKDAQDAGTPILAGDVPVRLAIPGWASFRFPDSAGGEPD